METLDYTVSEMRGTRMPSPRPATVLGSVVASPCVHRTEPSFAQFDTTRVWVGVLADGGVAPKGPSPWSPPI